MNSFSTHSINTQSTSVKQLLRLPVDSDEQPIVPERFVLIRGCCCSSICHKSEVGGPARPKGIIC